MSKFGANIFWIATTSNYRISANSFRPWIVFSYEPVLSGLLLCFRFALVNVGACWSKIHSPQICHFVVLWFVLLKAHKQSRLAFNSLTKQKAISQERMVKCEFEGCEFEGRHAPTFTRAKRKQKPGEYRLISFLLWIVPAGTIRGNTVLMILSSLQKSAFFKLTILFLQYFWCLNWDQWHNLNGKNSHIFFFNIWFKNK